MSEKYRVGLSRNRLFEFDNAVIFSGRFVGFSVECMERALKILCLKEPLLTSTATLVESGECFVETESVEPILEISTETSEQIKTYYEQSGIDFSRQLFKFVYSADSCLVIVAHTLVADAKSLLRLAVMFYRLCSGGHLSVSPSEVLLFSNTASLPAEINSPLTDKLSAELDDGWQKEAKIYGLDDYNAARKKYFDNKKKTVSTRVKLDENEVAKIKAFCNTLGIDCSSAVAFAFYKSLFEKLKPEKKHSKLCIHADRRFFFEGASKCFVAPFNGFCEASVGKKEEKLSLEEQLKTFHLSCYKGVTSSFKTFYDELLLMKVSPSYCDGSYMYLGGCASSKALKKLACNYGCMNTQLCEFFSCNLAQNYWEGMSAYSDVYVAEPLKHRFPLNVSLVMNARGWDMYLKYNTAYLSEDECCSVTRKAESLLSELCCK